MSSIPLVSIIIPVYNRENLVSKAIESAINQTYNNIEIIIGDNCSTDGTWAVLKQYSQIDTRVNIFRNTSNIGPVGNWKECINRANGLYTKILFSDDWMSIDYIEKTVDILHNNSEVGFVISDINIVNNDKVITLDYKVANNISTKKYLEMILLNNHLPVSPGAAIFRTKDLISNLINSIPNPLNLKCEKFGAGNDLLIYLLTANQYKYIHVSNSTKVFFLDHSGSFTISKNLEYYYSAAKFYFYKKTKNTFFANFIIYLHYNRLNDANYKLLFDLVKHDFNFIVFAKIVIKKLWFKIKSFL